MSKLTANEIKEVQTLYAIGFSKQAIAKAYDVSNPTIGYHTRLIAPLGESSLKQIARIIMLHDPKETERLTEMVQLRHIYTSLLAA